MLSDVQRAMVSRALKKLDADPTYVHPIAIIRDAAGVAAAREVTELTGEYREANKAAKENGGAMLSGEAADWWQDAQGVLAYGRLALSQGSRAAEKRLSQKCERLAESFDARVPEQDKRKFVVYDVQAEWALGGDGYDDRWNWTVDHRFPLLDPQFQESIPVENPVGEAQRVILMGLLDEREPEEQVANSSRLTAMLTRFTEAYEAGERKADSTAYKKQKAAQKKAEAAKAKAILDAKIAAGDQQATKTRRGNRLKLVDSVFELPAKLKKPKKAKSL